MTDRVGPERMSAVRSLNKFLAMESGRKFLRTRGYESGTPIVPAHESESIASVMRLVAGTEKARAVIAVHFPDRDTNLEFVEIERTAHPDGDVIDTGRGESSIGMLIDSMARRPSGSMALASELVLSPMRVLAGR